MAYISIPSPSLLDRFEFIGVYNDGTAKSQFFVVRASSLHKIYCRQDACTTIGSHPIASSILFTGSSYNGEKRWRSNGGKRLYTWDGLPGEIEVFNQRGKHLGAIDPQTGS